MPKRKVRTRKPRTVKRWMVMLPKAKRRGRRYPTLSKSTRFSVWVYYKGGLDMAFDEALFRFGRLYGMGVGGSGMGMAGKYAGVRDISFCCGTWERAREFQEAVRTRFKVRTKLREDAEE